MRLNLCNPLESRDGTIAKDSRMKNLLVENIEGVPTAIKRPGIENGFAGIPGGSQSGQGMVSLNGGLYCIFDDVLYIGDGGIPLVSAWSAGIGYAEGDEVSYEGEQWVATQDSLGQMPGAGSAYWELVQQISSWVQI